MNLSKLSINNPVFAWMLMIALILFGAICFTKMGISQLPDIDFPNVSISVSLEGASPSSIEVDVIDPLEKALMGVEGVKNISSTSRMGEGRINIEFKLNKNIDTAVSEIQTVLARAVRDLPKDTTTPIVSKTNPDDQPIVWLTAYSEKMERIELMELVENRIQNQFSMISGVGEVFIGGFINPKVRVTPNLALLKKHDITVNDLVTAINTEHVDRPSGRIEGDLKEYNIKTLGEATTLESFKNIFITKRGGALNYNPVRLQDVAKIEEGLDDIRRISRVDGMPAVGLGIKKQRGANAVAVAEGVRAKLQEITKYLPEGVNLSVRYDSTKFIKESIHELNFTLILSAILTSLVCWLFLGSLSATFNVVLAIPTSVIGSFIFLYALGFTLNTFTLLALSLAIGIVVDDAIMVLENIVRYLEKGEKRRNAALIGAKEISFAALAATAAIIAIFLPVAFMEGIIGKFFFQFGVTLSVAVFLSLIEALTLTPMRSAEFLSIAKRSTRIGKSFDHIMAKLSHIYKKVLPLILFHRWKTILLSLLFFILSIGSSHFLKKEFSPAQDQGLLMLRFNTPPGSSIFYTDAKAKELESILKNDKNIEHYFANIGMSDVNSGMMFLNLVPKSKRELSQEQVGHSLRKKLKNLQGIQTRIFDPSLAGFSNKRGMPIEVALQGPDFEELGRLTKVLMDEMEKSQLMTDVDSDFKEGMPEIQIFPNRVAAKNFGVSVSDITSSINILIGGMDVGKFTKDGHRLDIKIRLDRKERSIMQDIYRLSVRNNRGEMIALKDLVTIKEVMALQSISRENQERSITLYANMAPKVSQSVALAKVLEIAKKKLPSGYILKPSGSSETMKTSFLALIAALVLGIIISYMILGSQFNSFIHPFTVLMALPFSISGALIALLLTGHSINLYSMIGIILLMGIVKKNSILLVDFTNHKRSEGFRVDDALIEACPIRLRPILMTSFATIAGAVPAALAFGPGAETRSAMAITIIGGVLLSTILTLFIVPAVYSLLSQLEKKTDLTEPEL